MLAAETITKVEEEKKEEKFIKPKKTKVFLFLVIFVLIIVFLIGIFSIVFSIINMINNKIIQGVYIREIDVSGLTQDEAKSKVYQILNDELAQDIMLIHNEYNKTINSNQINFIYNIDDIVKKAYQIGREDNIIKNNYKTIDVFLNKTNIELTYNYDKELLEPIFSDIDNELPDSVKQPSYYIENDNIILYPGQQGFKVKRDELEKLIINTILGKNEENKVYIPVEAIEPYLVDVDKFRELIYVEPKDAYYTKDPFVVYPEVIGVDFNTEEVKQMLQEPKESYKIKLVYTTPKITKNQIGTEAFPDLLASFSTKYKASDRDRTTNLKLASNKINGVVLLPGEVFSYNATLGPRTSATGYKSAKIFSNGEVIDGVGGGICQISSTLYNAALYANLDIIERRNHQFVPSYLKAGLDATVVYGSQDFKFKNSRNYPIKIISNVENGIAKIDIFGVKEEVEYDIKIQASVIQSNSNSIKSVTYKYKYLDGNEIEKTVISRDTYKRN